MIHSATLQPLDEGYKLTRLTWTSPRYLSIQEIRNSSCNAINVKRKHFREYKKLSKITFVRYNYPWCPRKNERFFKIGDKLSETSVWNLPKIIFYNFWIKTPKDTKRLRAASSILITESHESVVLVIANATSTQKSWFRNSKSA